MEANGWRHREYWPSKTRTQIEMPIKRNGRKEMRIGIFKVQDRKRNENLNGKNI